MVWKLLGGVAAILLLLMLFGMYIESTPEGAQKTRDREAIAACRASQADTAAEQSTRRLTRQACDEMERDFRARWGVAP